MTTLTLRASATDNQIECSDADWATALAGASPSLGTVDNTSIAFGAATSAGPTYHYYRQWLPFDLSGLAGHILSATLAIRVTTNGDPSNLVFCLTSGSAAIPITTAAWANVGSLELAPRIGPNGSAPPYTMTFTLNAAGLSYLQSVLGGTAQLCVRHNHDVDAEIPTASAGYAWFDSGDAVSAPNRPTLTINILEDQMSITKAGLIAAAIESVEGTAETLANTDLILASNIQVAPTIVMNNRVGGGASISMWPAVAGMRTMHIMFDVDLRGSGSAGTAPDYGTVIQACGFGEDVQAGSVTYTPISTAIPCVTLAALIDGHNYVMAGARGNMKIDLKCGAGGVVHFDFLGCAINDNQSGIAENAWDQIQPPAFMDATLTMASYAALVENVSFDMGNVLTVRPSANEGGGCVSTVITSRKPQMTMDPEDVTVATQDWWTLWEAGTTSAFSTVLDGTAGNIVTITAPAAQIQSLTPTDKNGIQTQNMTCLLARSDDLGEDELSIEFT